MELEVELKQTIIGTTSRSQIAAAAAAAHHVTMDTACRLNYLRYYEPQMSAGSRLSNRIAFCLVK